MENNEKILSSLKPLVAKMARDLVTAMKSKHGIDLMITSGYRSIAEQDAIYAQGRTTPGSIVTQAKGGFSFHNFGVAFDCVPLIGGKPLWTSQYVQTAAEASTIGLEHGDRGYTDLPHFECRLGYSLEDFQNGKVDWSRYELSTLENNQNNHMEPTNTAVIAENPSVSAPVETPMATTTVNMAGQTVPLTQNVDITKETPQVLRVTKVTASYEHFVNDELVDTYSVAIPVTPEIIAAVNATDASDYNITVVSA